MTTPADPTDAAPELDPTLSALLERMRALLERAAEGPRLEEVREAYQAVLVDTAAWIRDGDPRQADQTLAPFLDVLESDARTFFGDPELEGDARGSRLAILRGITRAARRLARHAGGKPLRDEVPFLLSELRDAENGFHVAHRVPEGAEESEEPPVHSVEDALLRLSQARRSVLQAHVAHLLSEAETCTAASPDEALRAFRMARSLEATRFRLREEVARLARSPFASANAETEVNALGARVQKARVRLLDCYYNFLIQQPADEAAPLIRTSSSWLVEELDEARVSSVDDLHALDVQRLERLDDKATRFLEHVHRERSEGHAEHAKTLRQVRRSVGKQRRLLRRERGDQVLALRLARFFGPRTVRIWETCIFWLIIGVVGLLVVDHYRTPDPEGVIGWTTWVDTGICALLLLDFFTRVSLHPRRLSYFARHALTDLVPSIPFALLLSMQSLGAAKLLRLIRVVRILPALRPMLRFARLFLFFSRAMDRLVERNRWILDRKIVFFRDSEPDEPELPALQRIRDLERWISRSTSRMFAELELAPQQVAADWRASLVEFELQTIQAVPSEMDELSGLLPTVVREVEVDDAVQFLRRLDDGQVAEATGFDFARDLTSSLRVFRLPVLRKVPVVRFIFGPHGEPDPLITTARVGNVLGDLLARIQRGLHWFADLHGTITGAQFLDRVGLQLVQATGRPAKRLLAFGLGSALVFLLINALNLGFLDPVSQFLLRYLSGWVLLLGVVCLIPLLIGMWFRKIAGKVADLYDRVSEAQFLGQTETLKDERSAEDLRTLVNSSLRPELRLRLAPGESLSEEEEERLHALRNAHAWDAPPADLPLDWAQCNTVLLLYRQYADGGFFHRNDTKISSLLVGNLTLENIRIDRLGWTEKQRGRLESLNLGADRVAFTGPILWHRFITRAVSHQVARLILDYNAACIPVEELEHAGEDDQRLYQQWLARRRALSDARRENRALSHSEEEALSPSSGSLTYRTTEFNALHFLADDALRDASVRRRFGEEVAKYLREDRRYLIRDIFGTYPPDKVAPRFRAFNPYDVYRRYASRGRFALAPLWAAGLAFQGLRLLLTTIVRIVRDVIRPDERPLEVNAGHASFQVARRKIHRMRRPVAIEALRLRAAFDPEYLGVLLPGHDALTAARQVGDDLRTLQGTQREWEHVRELRSTSEHRVRVLSRLLHGTLSSRDDERPLTDCVAARSKLLGARPAESLRAMTLAFACDHNELATLTESLQKLEDFLEQLPKERPRFRLPPLLPRRILRLADRHWASIADSAVDDDTRRAFRRALLRHTREMLPHLETLERLTPTLTDTADPEAPHDLRESLCRHLLAIGEQPFTWTEQLIAVRAIQTLSLIDLANYEHLVADLGDFPEDDVHGAPPATVT